jgi:hypothetical protein
VKRGRGETERAGENKKENLMSIEREKNKKLYIIYLII